MIAIAVNDAEALTLSWRQEKAAPLANQFYAWLKEQQNHPDVLPKNPIG